MSQQDRYGITVHCGVRLDAIRVTTGKNEETSFSAGVLHGETQAFRDELLRVSLARHRLEDLEHGCQIKMLDRCLDGPGRIAAQIVPSEVRVQLLQLPYFAVGSPCQITGPGLLQVGPCDPVEAACLVEACGELCGERL